MDFLIALAELGEAVQAQAVQNFTLSAQILSDPEKFKDCIEHLEKVEAVTGEQRSADRRKVKFQAVALRDLVFSVVHFADNIDASGGAEAVVFDRVHSASGTMSVRQALLATFIFHPPARLSFAQAATTLWARGIFCGDKRGVTVLGDSAFSFIRDAAQPSCHGPRQLDRFDLSCVQLKDAETGARTAAHNPATGGGFGYQIYASARVTGDPRLHREETRRVRDWALAVIVIIVSTIHLSRVVQTCQEERTSRSEFEKRQPRRKDYRASKPRRVSGEGEGGGAVTRDMSVLSSLVSDLLTVLNLLAVHRFQFDSLLDVVGPWLGLSLFCPTFPDRVATSTFSDLVAVESAEVEEAVSSADCYRRLVPQLTVVSLGEYTPATLLSS
jgi:hypothetical protein